MKKSRKLTWRAWNTCAWPEDRRGMLFRPFRRNRAPAFGSFYTDIGPSWPKCAHNKCKFRRWKTSTKGRPIARRAWRPWASTKCRCPASLSASGWRCRSPWNVNVEVVSGRKTDYRIQFRRLTKSDGTTSDARTGCSRFPHRRMANLPRVLSTQLPY